MSENWQVFWKPARSIDASEETIKTLKRVKK